MYPPSITGCSLPSLSHHKSVSSYSAVSQWPVPFRLSVPNAAMKLLLCFLNNKTMCCCYDHILANTRDSCVLLSCHISSLLRLVSTIHHNLSNAGPETCLLRSFSYRYCTVASSYFLSTSIATHLT